MYMYYFWLNKFHSIMLVKYALSAVNNVINVINKIILNYIYL